MRFVLKVTAMGEREVERRGDRARGGVREEWRGWREAARTAVVDYKVQIGAERVDAPVHCLISPRAHLGQIHRMSDDVVVSLNLTRWHGEVGIWRVMAAATVPCGELIEYTCRLEMRDLDSAATGRVGARGPGARRVQRKTN